MTRARRDRRSWTRPLILGLLLGGTLAYTLDFGAEYTSRNSYCESCHVHPQATDSWKKGLHVNTRSGVAVACVACHLPPRGWSHFQEKVVAATRDFYGYYFTDIKAIDWEARSTLQEATRYTFDAACLDCHVELFPTTAKSKAVDAHLHYRKNRGELHCINCHLDSGHLQAHPVVTDTPPAEAGESLAPLVDTLAEGELSDYTEQIPESGVRFQMIAIQGGRFQMGSPAQEPGREPDEGPRREVEVGSFWMGKLEVTWDEYDAFYSATATRGKNEKGELSDAITGPTPPYGSPDQGWGKGRRPAITMTHYAARKYTEWLSSVTGRAYRLPTEAEWEYACRAGTEGAYYFQSSQPQGWFDRLLGKPKVSKELLAETAWYRFNSSSRTHPAHEPRKPNPWGLLNMLGNVKEFCLDYYDAGILAGYPEGPVSNPRGPDSGEEHVVRGGSFQSPAEDLRSAARDSTRHAAWLKTDPQTPKSVWWYSDNHEVGFRVVRPFDEGARVHHNPGGKP